MQEMDRLAEIIARLRSPDGCQWDREQTFSSVKSFVLEEAYEVIESIDHYLQTGDASGMCEETGDLCCQLVFLAQLAREKKLFTMQDALNSISDKLIRRHPHVFGEIKTNDTDKILANWEKIKAEEKKSSRKSILDGITSTLPALSKAYKIQTKAARVGFDWDQLTGVMDKINEEMGELQSAIESGDPKQIEDEFGDLLFGMVNIARFLKLNPELALGKTVNKFYQRFRYIEEQLSQRDVSLQDATIDEMEALWQESKHQPHSVNDTAPAR